MVEDKERVTERNAGKLMGDHKHKHKQHNYESGEPGDYVPNVTASPQLTPPTNDALKCQLEVYSAKAEEARAITRRASRIILVIFRKIEAMHLYGGASLKRICRKAWWKFPSELSIHGALTRCFSYNHRCGTAEMFAVSETNRTANKNIRTDKGSCSKSLQIRTRGICFCLCRGNA